MQINFNVQEWLSGKIVTHPLETQGVYINLICMMFKSGTHLKSSDNALSRRFGLDTDKYKEIKLNLIVDGILLERDKHLSIKWVDIELNRFREAEERREQIKLKRSEAGKKGGRGNKKTHKSTATKGSKANAKQMLYEKSKCFKENDKNDKKPTNKGENEDSSNEKANALIEKQMLYAKKDKKAPLHTTTNEQIAILESTIEGNENINRTAVKASLANQNIPVKDKYCEVKDLFFSLSEMERENFKKFWELYPVKTNKKKAQTNFFYMVKGRKCDFPTMIKKVKEFSKWSEQTDARFIPEAGTWIYNERWEDDYQIYKPSNRKQAPDYKVWDEMALKGWEMQNRKDKDGANKLRKEIKEKYGSSALSYVRSKIQEIKQEKGS